MHGNGEPNDRALGPRPGAHALWSDEELLEATRADDPHAFAELWRRYEPDARRFARSLVAPKDVDDVVGEAFTKVLNAIRHGNGPRTHPVRYIMVSVRSAAYSLGGARARDSRLAGRVRLERSRTVELELADEHLEEAVRALPRRWREVLWWTEVEGLSRSDVSRRLGISLDAAAALSYRARNGLRAEYVRRSSAPWATG